MLIVPIALCCPSALFACTAPVQLILVLVASFALLVHFAAPEGVLIAAALPIAVWPAVKVLLHAARRTYPVAMLVAGAIDGLVTLYQVFAGLLAVGAPRPFSADALTSPSRMLAAMAYIAAVVLSAGSSLAAVAMWDRSIWRRRSLLNRASGGILRGAPRTGILIRHRPLAVKRAYIRYEVLRIRQFGRARSVLRINRETVEEDTQYMTSRPPTELRRQLVVVFRHEAGIDAGGMAREYFRLFFKRVASEPNPLFIPLDVGQHYISPKADPRRLHLAGIILGRAFLDGQLISVSFSPSIYRYLLVGQLTADDVAEHDPELFRHTESLLTMSSADLKGLGLTFSVSLSDGTMKELRPGGDDIDVDAGNVRQFVALRRIFALLGDGVGERLAALRAGWGRVVSKIDTTVLQVADLGLLIEGISEIAIDDWQRHTSYSNGFTATSPTVVAFWEVLATFTHTQRQALVQFTTGCASVPVSGFSGLPGRVKFNITRSPRLEAMPQAHTCFNSLTLPDVRDVDRVRSLLEWVVSLDSDAVGFHMA